MRVGAVYPQTELRGDPDAVRRIGLAVEDHGFDHLLAYDHVVGAIKADRDPPLWGPYDETHPFHADTDWDMLDDGTELTVESTDPLDPDTDGGRTGDGQEVYWFATDPLNASDDIY